MNFFVTSFVILALLCAVLCFYTQKILIVQNNREFSVFQTIYLAVYTLAMAGDWLQGPYVYALYEHYGMTKRQIEILFVAGFGSSMLFGTVVGAFADKYGRRLNCLLYGAIYIFSCITKHFNKFEILLIGRLSGGIATSILFSAFESWLVCQHNTLGFDSNHLKVIFSNGVLCNSIIAIVCGIAAQYAVDNIGFVAPFDIAIAFLTAMSLVIVSKWSENYGDQKTNLRQSFSKSLKLLRTDMIVLCLGVTQSLFESSMYCFVLEWTPILEEAMKSANSKSALPAFSDIVVDGHRGLIPHGYVFAAFMVALMIGSCCFKLLCKVTQCEAFMRIIFICSALCFAVPILLPKSPYIIFFAFLVFELCVGVFWPSMGTMRSEYVPEDVRATIMNCFRVPLNLIVVVILSQNLSPSFIFTFCTGSVLLAAAFQQWMFMLIGQRNKFLSSPSKGDSNDCLESLIVDAKSDEM